jgi:hypothetical protein
VPYSIAGISGIAAASTSVLNFYPTDGAGGFLEPEDAGIVLSGIPRLASDTDSIAIATAGETLFYELDSQGIVAAATAGSIVDLAAGKDGWALALSNPMLLEEASQTSSLSTVPLALATADLNGDTQNDLVVLETGLIEAFLSDGTLLSVSVGMDISGIAGGDLDGDGCAELVVISTLSGSIQPIALDGCVLSPDADGDGLTLADGDCDDFNSEIHPGAIESCDGLDNNCNGAVDELAGATMEFQEEVGEGEPIIAWATAEGCISLSWNWTMPPAELAACGVADGELYCNALDDGILPLHVEGLSEEGEVLVVLEEQVSIINVDPSMTLPADFRDGELHLSFGELYTSWLTGHDPGVDTVSFTAIGEPDFFDLTPTGDLLIRAESAGMWSITIIASDEDGGSTSSDLTLYVEGADSFENLDSSFYNGSVDYGLGCDDDDSYDWGCTGCCGSPGMALLLGIGFLRRRIQ